MLSDVSFVQARVHAKFIHPLGRGRLIARTDLGATSVSLFDNLPATVRFYAGGDQSVRALIHG